MPRGVLSWRMFSLWFESVVFRKTPSLSRAAQVSLVRSAWLLSSSCPARFWALEQ